MMYLYLYKSALRDLLRPGRLITALFLALAPSALAIICRLTIGSKDFPPVAAYNAFESTLVFGFALVIPTVIFVTGVISQEVEQKTIVYLLTRPVARAGILLSRFAAAVTVVVATTWLGTVALALSTFGASRMHNAPVIHDLGILLVGALAYGALFLLIATALARPLIWSLLFVFGWESWVPLLPGYVKAVSVMEHLRVLAPHAPPQADTVDLNNLLSTLNSSDISTKVSWIVLICIIVIGIAGATVLFSQKEYVPRDDAI